MKKFYLLHVIVILLSCGLSFSCRYGLSQFMYRSDEANARSPALVNLNKEGKAPDIGTDSKFSAIVLTDIHFGRSGYDASTRPDDSFFTWLSAKQAELSAAGAPAKFCICLGDCVETGKTDEYAEYYNFCTKMKQTYGLQVYSIAGNHDLFNSGWSTWKQTCYPYVSSYMFTTAQGSNAMNWFFLDSGNGTLGYNQLTDCVDKMNRNTNAKLVFTHYPIYAGGIFYFTLQNETERDTLLAAFGRDNVKQVLEGHVHKGKSYSFGNQFTETLLNGYLDYRSACVLTVDLVSQNATVTQFSF